MNFWVTGQVVPHGAEFRKVIHTSAGAQSSRILTPLISFSHVSQRIRQPHVWGPSWPIHKNTQKQKRKCFTDLFVVGYFIPSLLSAVFTFPCITHQEVMQILSRAPSLWWGGLILSFWDPSRLRRVSSLCCLIQACFCLWHCGRVTLHEAQKQ